VLTVPSLGGQDIEEFSIRVADAWLRRSRSGDNRVLVAFAPVERMVWIEVGSGPWEAIPGVLTRHVVASDMIPACGEEPYAQGLQEGLASPMAASRLSFQPDDTEGESRPETIVRVLDTGSPPRLSLRSGPSAGSKGTIKMTMRQNLSMTLNAIS